MWTFAFPIESQMMGVFGLVSCAGVNGHVCPGRVSVRLRAGQISVWEESWVLGVAGGGSSGPGRKGVLRSPQPGVEFP